MKKFFTIFLSLILIIIAIYSLILFLNRDKLRLPVDYINIQNQSETDIDNVGKLPEALLNCRVHLRSSMNIPQSANTYENKSDLECTIDGKKDVILELTDKINDSSKNNIYRVWKTESGLSLLIVDQNGGGSGEGIGKIVNLTEDNTKLSNCFYYYPEDFSRSRLGSVDLKLSPTEFETVENRNLDLTSSQCNNFKILRK